MEENTSDARYELPSHRLKILGTVIFSLLLFLIYTISSLDGKTTVLDFFLLPIIVILAFWFKNFLKKYSKVGFLINEQGLFNLDKSPICKMHEIDRVDASPYTFKSANGFIIILKTKNSFESVPGLYWKVGKRISIGGLVSKNESKFLSGLLLQFLEEQKLK